MIVLEKSQVILIILSKFNFFATIKKHFFTLSSNLKPIYRLLKSHLVNFDFDIRRTKYNLFLIFYSCPVSDRKNLQSLKSRFSKKIKNFKCNQNSPHISC